MALSVIRSGRGLAGLALALAASLMLMALSLVALGCDPGHGVTFENQTNKQLSVYRFDRYDFRLEALQKTRAGILQFGGDMLVEAKDDNGNVVYSKSFTWEQLKQMNWEIMITDTSQPPQPSPTASARPP